MYIIGQKCPKTSVPNWSNLPICVKIYKKIQGDFMNLEYTVLDTKYQTIKEVLKSHFRISDRLLTKLKKNNKIYLNNENKYIDYKIKINDIIRVNLDFNEKSENIVPKK